MLENCDHFRDGRLAIIHGCNFVRISRHLALGVRPNLQDRIIELVSALEAEFQELCDGIDIRSALGPGRRVDRSLEIYAASPAP